MFEDWRPWNEVLRKVGDGSGTYEALRIFLDSAIGLVYDELRKTYQRSKEIVEEKRSLGYRIEKHSQENENQGVELEKMRAQQTWFTS